MSFVENVWYGFPPLLLFVSHFLLKKMKITNCIISWKCKLLQMMEENVVNTCLICIYILPADWTMWSAALCESAAAVGHKHQLRPALHRLWLCTLLILLLGSRKELNDVESKVICLYFKLYKMSNNYHLKMWSKWLYLIFDAVQCFHCDYQICDVIVMYIDFQWLIVIRC